MTPHPVERAGFLCWDKKAFEEFVDAKMATAPNDRLKYRGHIIETGNASYRITDAVGLHIQAR